MSYLPLRHDKREQAIRTTIRALKNASVEFDSIVCTGLSGALVAPHVAAKLKKNLVLIRKGESSHGELLEHVRFTPVGNYIIVDDLIETGRTITRIKKIMSMGWFDESVTCVGVFLYSQSENTHYFERYRQRFPKLWLHAKDSTR